MHPLNRIRALSRGALAFVLLLVMGQAAGEVGSGHRAEFSTITNTDGTFQVHYPQQLVRCEHLDAENPDVWSPEGSCVATLPVCDSSGHAGNVLACLAYPASAFHGSELQAAAFSISRLDSFRTPDECNHKWTNRDTSNVHEERMAGTKMQSAEVVETQGSYVARRTIYRTFHREACYELDVNIATALDSAFAAEDTPRKLTSAERGEIKDTLMLALKGFRFLK
jgi:hypothetical protein